MASKEKLEWLMDMNYGIFEGNGNSIVHPTTVTNSVTNQLAIRISRASARKLIDRFLKDGISVHSKSGKSVWVIQEYCLAQQINFKITYMRNQGVIIEMVKNGNV